MKIIIAGAGEVGCHLAKLLSREEQDITVVDTNADRLNFLDQNYNLLTYQGSPTSFATLREAGASDCDLFIAVTPFEANNILACNIAKSYGAKKAVARIDNYEYLEQQQMGFFNKQGVNAVIYPEDLAATEISKALERNWARFWFEMHDGELIVIGIKIRENAPLCNKRLKDLAMSEHFFHVSAIKRNNETIIPRGDDMILNNDIIYVTTTQECVEQLREICGKQRHDLRRLMIIGGSHIAVRLLDIIGDRYDVTLIESNRDRCTYLSEKCPYAQIINADGRDIETLQEEGLDETDVFIALTENSETNIITALSAKEYGVKKTIAEVEDLQFISFAENLNIGTIINKKLLLSGCIFQAMLDEDTESSKFMALADADVADIEVKEGANITKAQVKDLKLPADFTIAGLIRDGRGMLVQGNTLIKAGDHVVVLFLNTALRKLEKMFN